MAISAYKEPEEKRKIFVCEFVIGLRLTVCRIKNRPKGYTYEKRTEAVYEESHDHPQDVHASELVNRFEIGDDIKQRDNHRIFSRAFRLESVLLETGRKKY